MSVGDDGDPHNEPRPSGPEETRSRRRVLSWVVAGLGAAIAAVPLVPAIGYFLLPARRGVPEVWRAVGRLADFPIGATVRVTYVDPAALTWSGFAGESAALLRRTSATSFVAFSPFCTHVGCPVRWEEGAGLFMCPCHGGAFHADGTVAAGPPPEPLVRHDVRVRAGRVEIRTRPNRLPG